VYTVLLACTELGLHINKVGNVRSTSDCSLILSVTVPVRTAREQLPAKDAMLLPTSYQTHNVQFLHILDTVYNRLRLSFTVLLWQTLPVSPSNGFLVVKDAVRTYYVRQMYARRVECHLPLSDFDQTLILSTKVTSTEFHKNPTDWSRVIPCGRTDRHDEANCCFSQLPSKQA
jgi:hypothetical protein